MLAQLVQVIQMAVIAFIIFGEQIFGALGMRVPEVYVKIQQNKWMFGFLAWFIGNSISGGMLSTGAYEIYIDDQLVYSKLEMHKMPDQFIINSIFRAHGI